MTRLIILTLLAISLATAAASRVQQSIGAQLPAGSAAHVHVQAIALMLFPAC